MKKIYKIITLLLVVVFLAGCAANAEVNPATPSIDEPIVLENQDANIILPEVEIQPIINVNQGDFGPEGVVFNNIGEMASAVKRLYFPEKVIQAFKKAHLVTENEDGACVMSSSQDDDIYYVTVPQGCTVRNSIEYSTYYTYQCMVGDDKVASASLLWFHNDVYNNAFMPTNHDEAFSRDRSLFTKQEVIKRGIEMDEYTIHDRYGTRKVYIYTLTEGDKTLFVYELYIVEATKYEVQPASEYPYLVTIFGIDGGEYFKVHATSMKTDVTNEWLLSFGLQKYQSDVVTE